MSTTLHKINEREIEERKAVSVSDIESSLRQVLDEKVMRLKKLVELQEEIELQNQKIAALRNEQTRITDFLKENQYPDPTWMSQYPDPMWIKN